MQPTDTLNGYPSPVYQMLNVNWSDFLEGILLTLQGHDWNNGTNGGHWLGGGDLGLFLLPLWPTNVVQTIVWASWLLLKCPKWGFLPLPTPPSHPHPTLPHPTAHPTHPLQKLNWHWKRMAKIPWNSAIHDL